MNSFAAASFTADEQIRLSNITSRDFIESFQIIEVAPIESLLNNGFVDFVIPGVGNVVSAETVSFEEIDGGIKWYASLNNEEGHMILTTRNGYTGGVINISSAFYSIEPIKIGVSALIKHDVSIDHFGPETCATENGTSTGNPGPEEECTLVDPCSTTMTIGIVLTPEALSYLNDPSNNLSPIYFDVGLATLQMSLWNSKVYNKSINYKILFDEFPFHPDSLLFISGPYMRDIYGPEISISNELDMVILLSNHRYDQATGIACEGLDVSCISAITSIEHLLTPRYTFAHEIGHILGAGHARTLAQPGEEDECAFGYHPYVGQINQVEKTILSFDPVVTPGVNYNSNRILYFSNPDVEYIGAATGTVMDQNAVVIDNNSCEIGNQFPTQEMEVSIWGPNSVCNEGTLFSSSVINAAQGVPGQPPYTYEWHWNTSGHFGQNTNAELIGTGPTVSIGNLACSRFYLSLTVVSVDGAVKRITRKVDTKGCLSCITGIIDDPIGRLNNPEKTRVFPNPTNNQISFNLNEINLENASILIYDSNQRIVETLNLDKLEKNQFQLDMSTYPSGIYFINIVAMKFTETHKVIKL